MCHTRYSFVIPFPQCPHTNLLSPRGGANPNKCTKEKRFGTLARSPTVPPNGGGWLRMKASKVIPSGRILTKLWISETAWSIGKSLYNRTQRVSSSGAEGGKIYGRFVFQTLVPPPFSWRLGPQPFIPDMFDLQTRSRKVFIRRDEKTLCKKTLCKDTHKIGDANRLLKTRFPARTNQFPSVSHLHLLPRGALRSSGNS